MVDVEYLELAYYQAVKSPDPSTQNGAIIVKNKQIIGQGFNEFPAGVKYADERWERPIKYSYIEHAERNAIFDCVRKGNSTVGAVMYCPWYACADCGRAIIQAGIKEVVGHMLPAHKDNPRWKDSIAFAIAMFEEAGVKYRYVEAKISAGDIKFRMNGELIEP